MVKVRRWLLRSSSQNRWWQLKSPSHKYMTEDGWWMRYTSDGTTCTIVCIVTVTFVTHRAQGAGRVKDAQANGSARMMVVYCPMRRWCR